MVLSCAIRLSHTSDFHLPLPLIKWPRRIGGVVEGVGCDGSVDDLRRVPSDVDRRSSSVDASEDGRRARPCHNHVDGALSGALRVCG